MRTGRIFLLSPADCSGTRARMVLDPRSRFDLALRVRAEQGAPLGEVFSFMSGLYFRGKLSYARAFASPPEGMAGVLVITPSDGLRPADEPITTRRLQRFARVAIDEENASYRRPLMRDARRLAAAVREDCEVILLGSVATGKYVDVLGKALGDRLRFPLEFIGRGDMSRGGLMLRCVDARSELTYIPVAGAMRHGPRPPRLEPRSRRLDPALPTSAPRSHQVCGPLRKTARLDSELQRPESSQFDRPVPRLEPRSGGTEPSS